MTTSPESADRSAQTSERPRNHPCGARHWFVYRGMVGSSSPICVRYGCGAPNPRYDPNSDPFLPDVYDPQVGDRFVWAPGIEDSVCITVEGVDDSTVKVLRDGGEHRHYIERGAFATYARPWDGTV